MMDSEPALQRTYADLLMLIRPEMRHFSVYDLLLEFKFIPLNSLRIDKKKVAGQELRGMTREQLLAFDTVTEKVNEATAQLQTYQQVLQKKYGAVLKLRTYVVVSVGLERLIWEEV